MVVASPRTMRADGHLAHAQGVGDAGRAVPHDVQRAQPQPGATGVQPGAAQAGAGDLGQSSLGAGGGLAAAGAQVVDGGRGQAGGCGDGPVAAAVVLEAAYLVADVTGNRAGVAGSGGGLADGRTGAGGHVSWLLRPGGQGLWGRGVCGGRS